MIPHQTREDGSTVVYVDGLPYEVACHPVSAVEEVWVVPDPTDNPDGAATYRVDAYYVQTHHLTRSRRNSFTSERVVSPWRWYLYFRWQIWRFRKAKGHHLLIERDWWHKHLSQEPDPRPR